MDAFVCEKSRRLRYHLTVLLSLLNATIQKSDFFTKFLPAHAIYLTPEATFNGTFIIRRMTELFDHNLHMFISVYPWVTNRFDVVILFVYKRCHESTSFSNSHHCNTIDHKSHCNSIIHENWRAITKNSRVQSPRNQNTHVQ